MGNNSKLYDTQLIRTAGIKPTPEELKHSINEGIDLTKSSRIFESPLYEAAKRDIRIMDEQAATSRFKWYNLPCDITGEELERFLYYKGQLCFFYDKTLEKFFFMPYALDGTIDAYGRYNSIHPVPMSNGTDQAKENSQIVLANVLAKKKLDCIYGIPLKPVDETKVCVLLHDHVKQLAENIIPRQQLNDTICGYEAELLAYMRTNAIAGSGVRGMRIGSSDDEQANVSIANKSLQVSALHGNVFTALRGDVEWQNLLEKGTAKMEEYNQAFQAIDNLRLATYGLGDGRVAEKKAHMLQTEADENQSNVGLILDSDLTIRQNFCNIINNIWGLGVWCEPNEAYSGQDIDGDGKEYSSDPSGSQAAVSNKEAE